VQQEPLFPFDDPLVERKEAVVSGIGARENPLDI
jgi:hypothetical protein